MKRAFTLIEMLVVIFILLILASAVVAVGSQFKASSARKSTLLTLKTCDLIMKDYIAAGHTEPSAETPANWSYSPDSPWTHAYAGNPPPPDLYLPTTPASDPIRWVMAL